MFKKKVVEKIRTHVLCSLSFSVKIVSFMRLHKKMVEPDRSPDDIIWRMRYACRMTKAIYTQSEYIILTAFPWQQWLRERA